MIEYFGWFAVGVLVGMLLSVALSRLAIIRRRSKRQGNSWYLYTRQLVKLELRSDVSFQHIQTAVAELALEQGFSQEWERQFVGVIRSRIRGDGTASLAHAISCIRIELEES